MSESSEIIGQAILPEGAGKHSFVRPGRGSASHSNLLHTLDVESQNNLLSLHIEKTPSRYSYFAKRATTRRPILHCPSLTSSTEQVSRSSEPFALTLHKRSNLSLVRLADAGSEEKAIKRKVNNKLRATTLTGT